QGRGRGRRRGGDDLDRLSDRDPCRRDQAAGGADTGRRSGDCLSSPAKMAREVWITGIGLASSLGEGLDAHWQAMALADTPKPVVDRNFVPPFSIHPMVALDLDKQIPKRADQRQM